MNRRVLQRLLVVLTTVIIVACGSGGSDIGPTIGDLAELPPILETTELEPEASFEVDEAELIESFRALVAVTAAGGGTGDELRRLADLELEASLDNRLSDDPETRQRGEQQGRRAIAIYEEYLEKYPDRPENDLVFYQFVQFVITRYQPRSGRSDREVSVLLF